MVTQLQTCFVEEDLTGSDANASAVCASQGREWWRFWLFLALITFVVLSDVKIEHSETPEPGFSELFEKLFEIHHCGKESDSIAMVFSEGAFAYASFQQPLTNT